MSWEPEIEELRRRLELAHAMGGPENVARQHKAGRLTVRERIERLLDPGSFHAPLHHPAEPAPPVRRPAAPPSRGRSRVALRADPRYGPSLVTALARLDGYPVGVMANDPRHVGGALTAAGSEKLTRFVDLCDTFHLPAVNFVDNPGFLIGVAAERAGTSRKGVRALAAVYQATVPWVTVILRRVFGVAGAGHGNVQALNLRYAWPSGDWGSLPLEGGSRRRTGGSWRRRRTAPRSTGTSRPG